MNGEFPLEVRLRAALVEATERRNAVSGRRGVRAVRGRVLAAAVVVVAAVVVTPFLIQSLSSHRSTTPPTQRIAASPSAANLNGKGGVSPLF